jgi:hypothetical protein
VLIIFTTNVPDACRPLPDDGQPDIAGYNKELEQLGSPSWFNIPWLYAECYLYRYFHLIIFFPDTNSPKLDA